MTIDETKRATESNVLNAIMIARESEELKDLRSQLARAGLNCTLHPDGEGMPVHTRSVDLVLVVIQHTDNDIRVPRGTGKPGHLPVIALVRRDALLDIDMLDGTDDFVVAPWTADEIIARAQHTLKQKGHTNGKSVIKCNNLVIDPETYEVALDGRLINLTFKEYQLLHLLASNKGQVFTRDSLLNLVWGYDYYGGDRAVDVYIRRVRSKIEDTNQEFIQTVRNVGYKFRKED
ncbi:MAG: winged-helix domain-containing protein [Dehalococcoidia bacterium]